MRRAYKLLLNLLALFLFSLLGSVGIITTAFYTLEPHLPSIETLKDVQLQVPLRVFSADEKLIAEFGEMKREPILYKDIPQTMIDAIIATEDENFFNHPGVDYKGILRAAVYLIRTGERGQGGSTITMQVARNFFLSKTKTFTRKINEIFLALKIERELSKEDILELYLNKIYLGHRSYGIAAAAKVYYGKSVQELDLAEYAMLAGLPKAPSTNNPVTNKKEAIERRNYVLKRMLKLGFITEKAFEEASAKDDLARIHKPDIGLEAPYIAEMVRAEMVERFGENAYTMGLNVFTSVDSHLQNAANAALRSALMEYEHRHGYKGPATQVELNPDASIEAKQKFLDGYSTVANLEPALVTDIDDDKKTANILLKNKATHIIEWDHIKWARKYINDRSLGPELKKVSDALKPGDIIYVSQMDDMRYQLAQIPEVSGAFIAADPRTGAIKALIGGFDFFTSNFNRAVQAKRQPGSVFKPFIYSAALNNGYTAASIINDAPVVFKDSYLEGYWRPDNYSGKFFGPTRLRNALTNSRNLVSIRLLRDIGIDYTVEYAGNFGFTADELPHNLTLALGSASLTPLQILKGYAIFANGGYDVTPWLIERVENAGKEIILSHQLKIVCSPDYSADLCPEDESHLAQRVVDEGNVFIMTTIMQDVIRFGTARKALALGRQDLSGKTGTTNEQVDAWFSGFNRHLVATAWVGFDTPRSLGRNETGGKAALPMWMKFMEVALKDTPEEELRVPDSIITVRIDKNSGLLARGGSADDTVYEYFISGTQPYESSAEQRGQSRETQTVTEELF